MLNIPPIRFLKPKPRSVSQNPLLQLQDISKINLNQNLWRIVPVGIEEFVRSYMGRNTHNGTEPSAKQWETLFAVFGNDVIPQQRLCRIDGFFKHRLLVQLVGQGGGKNWTSEIIACYGIYLWQCLSDPHYAFSLSSDQMFNIINMSQVNKEQGRRVFFDRLKQALKQVKCPKTGKNWFEKYCQFDIDKALHKDEFKIPCHIVGREGLVAWSGDSQSSTPEGYIIWMAFMDEPSRANTEATYRDAKKQYKVIDGNRNTRFVHPLNSFIGVFSYPEQEKVDLTVELYEQHKNDPLAYCMKATTFEYDPRKSINDLQFVQAFKDDPIDANRRFNCIIPKNNLSFFMPYIDKIKECANPELTNRISYTITVKEQPGIKHGKQTMEKFTIIDEQSLSIVGDDLPRIIFTDPGETGDAFTIACGYPLPLDNFSFKDTLQGELNNLENEFTNHGQNMQAMINNFSLASKPIIDTLIIIKPVPGCPIDYSSVENVIWKMLDAFTNVRGVHSDRFDSPLFISRIRGRGVMAETHHFSNPFQMRLYTVFRRFVWSNQAQYISHDKIIDELENLLKINNNKVDHPPAGSKDVADVLAGCSYYICQIPAVDGGAQVGLQSRDYVEAYHKLFKEKGGIAPTPFEIALYLKVDEKELTGLDDKRRYEEQMNYQRHLNENSANKSPLIGNILKGFGG